MIKIIKSKEPEVLKEFRKERKGKNGEISGKDYLAFQSLPEFKQLQTALLKEQKYVCCYCMAAIDETKMVVEHFKCRDKYGIYSLTYSNMLASCEGCINGNKDALHCDKNKKNLELKKLPNPADEKCDVSQLVSYSTRGELVLRDNNLSELEKTDFLVDINHTLNLNNEELRKARTDVALSFIQKFQAIGKIPKKGEKTLPFWGFTEWLLLKKQLI